VDGRLATASSTTTMTRSSCSGRPRLVPERPFPPYAYTPGQTPHPTRDPEGHSYEQAREVPEPLDPEQWRRCPSYLYGIDLFNHSYYWEAHEAWEGLWAASGRRGPTAVFLQALINLAAAGFKARLGNAPGLRANAETAARLLKPLSNRLGFVRPRYMGLDVRALADYASMLSRSDQATGRAASDRKSLAFDLELRPE
jgi:hypothetical protein